MPTAVFAEECQQLAEPDVLHDDERRLCNGGGTVSGDRGFEAGSWRILFDGF